MRKIKADVVVVGSGCISILAAIRAQNMGHNVALINPADDFQFSDLLPCNGLGLWNAAYRTTEKTSLSSLYDELIHRLKEVFPASVEEIGVRRLEHWGVLSSTPIYRSVTEDLEKEFFRIEKKDWSNGHFRLVNPDHILTRAKRLNLDLGEVANIDGAVIRDSALWWNAPMMAMHLMEYAKEKIEMYFSDVKVEGRHGRRVVISDKQGQEISVDGDRSLLFFLTGDLLPSIKRIVAPMPDSWMGGIRKRRREQHTAWFRKSAGQENVWIELGATKYFVDSKSQSTLATWTAEKGPDSLERVVDEGLRIQRRSKFFLSDRSFRLDWDWKGPQWRESAHDTYWATSFEGDLWSVMELVWNLPV